MIKKRNRSFYFVLGLLVLLGISVAGCRTAPVHNVQDAAIVTTKANVSAEDIEKAIVRAGASLGWNMKRAQEGLMLGTLNLRDHVAVIEIRYNSKAYSILYKDSQNLNYDGTNIHSNYNGWITRLNRAIQVQLSTL